jgi:hypothetical protein
MAGMRHDGVIRFNPTHSADTGARTEGPGPGFPPTLVGKPQGFFIHNIIDSDTQRPALLRSWAALQSYRRITIIIHNHNARSGLEPGTSTCTVAIGNTGMHATMDYIYIIYTLVRASTNSLKSRVYMTMYMTAPM